jgi:hypothetical protein
MSISQLVQFIPPPQAPIETGSPKRWEKAQERLGIAFPQDYKNFVDRYGTGTFNNLIIPYSPFAANEYMNLYQALDAHHQASRQTQWMADSAWSIVSPFQLYPAKMGLFPWGTTTHFEQAFFWQISGRPDTWTTILYDLRKGEYEVWKMCLTAFLLKLFKAEIESVLLPKGIWLQNQQVTFHQFKAVHL